MRLTKATTESICEAIKNGHAVRFACAFAGISQTSYFRWRARGLKALEARDDGIEPESTDEEAYLNFYVQTEKAHAEYVESCRKHIHDAMPKTWQAACWSLERRYPEEYGRFGMPLGELNEANAVEPVRKTENNTPTKTKAEEAKERLLSSHVRRPA